MLQLILHAIGDYLVQNDYLALNKKKPGWHGHLCCQIHCITYSLPFLFIGSWQATFAIYLSHFIIDRYHLVECFLALRNGLIKKPYEKYGFKYTLLYQFKNIENFGFGKDRPFAITIWLYIITDNIFHIICNYFALLYL